MEINSAVGTIRGRVAPDGKVQIVLELDAQPANSGRSEVLARSDGWSKLDNLLGEGCALNLCVTRRAARAKRG